MTRPLVALAAVMLLSLLVGVAPAAADRGLTQGEKRGMAHELRLAYGPGQFPARCLVGKRSTLNPMFAYVTNTNRGRCPRGDGFILFERIPGDGWAELGQGAIGGGRCREFVRYIDAPVGVLRHLRLCR